jgi:hypothetical protein
LRRMLANGSGTRYEIMSKYEDKSTSSPGYDSAMEEQIIEGLSRQLKAPWKIRRESADVRLSSSDAVMGYTPDLVLTNEDTGKVVVVELKQNLSLSMPNLIRFQNIQSEYEKSGAEFLLVVHGGESQNSNSESRLSEYGINAVDVTHAEDAALAIQQHLPDAK